MLQVGDYAERLMQPAEEAEVESSAEQHGGALPDGPRRERITGFGPHVAEQLLALLGGLGTGWVQDALLCSDNSALP